MVVKLRYEAPGEWDKAKCANYYLLQHDDPFFSEEDSEQDEAVDFCNGNNDGYVCPIRHECLMFALVNNEKYGVWGGTKYSTRKAMRRKFPPIKSGEPRKEWEWKNEEEWLKDLNLQEQSLSDREED